MMGKRRGRICFLHQVDFEEVFLEYTCEGKNNRITGQVKSVEEFNDAVSSILSFYQSDRLEVALKRFGVVGSRTTGICVKSFPRTPLTTHLLALVNLCSGGQSGTELVHLPFHGLVTEQPNVFIEAFHLFTNVYSKYVKDKTPKNEDKGQ